MNFYFHFFQILTLLFLCIFRHFEYINREAIQKMMECWVKSSKKLTETISSQHKKLRKNLTKHQFIEFANSEVKNTFAPLDKLHFLPYIDFCFNAPTPEIQCQIIRYLFEYEDDPQEYLNKHLNEGDKYFLIQTKFWQNWIQYVEWPSTKIKILQMDKEIDLDVPREKGFLRKLSSSLVYPNSFILIPEKVYETLKKWYSPTGSWPVSRKVIKYHEKRPQIYNPNALQIGKTTSRFSYEKGDSTYELNLHKLFFIGLRIHDDGEFPQIPQLTIWQRITGEKKNAPTFVELYISRYFYDLA